MKFRNKEQFFSGAAGDDPGGSPAKGDTVKESTELNAFLGKGCVYEGKLTFEGRVRIDGRFLGEIFTNDVLEVGRGADVRAEIDVATVIVSGDVQGNINARTRVDLKAPAKVRGNISTPVLTVEEGACFDGNLRMDTSSAAKAAGVTPPGGSRPAPTPTPALSSAANVGPSAAPSASPGLGDPRPRPTLGLKPVP